MGLNGKLLVCTKIKFVMLSCFKVVTKINPIGRKFLYLPCIKRGFSTFKLLIYASELYRTLFGELSMVNL